MKPFAKLKSVDFFRKLPSDLTEATLTGASLSVVATIVMIFLLIMEFSSFMSLKTNTTVVIDRSPKDDLLRINFNISFTKMSCEHITLDVSDSLGSKKINLSKTARKTPLNAAQESMGTSTRDENFPVPKYDDHDDDTLANTNYTAPMTTNQFRFAQRRYPLLVVNFYAPWCPWCQRLAPTWENVMNYAHTQYPVTDGRIRIAKVDCTVEVDLCNKQMITGFPSIRIYRKGTDDVVVGGRHMHEAYKGDRTEEALKAFVDKLVPSAGTARSRMTETRQLTLGEGCMMSGFVMVKKVPGTLHFHMKQEGMSFAGTDIDVSHFVNEFTFGTRPSPRRRKTLARLHPMGLDRDWADKLTGTGFISGPPETTHEHYLQLVKTTLEPLGGNPAAAYDAYEYTVQSHSYVSEMSDIPAAKFTFQTSAMQVVVQEQGRRWYHFLTTLCAIIGGVFTVCGILDNISYSTIKLIKKVELGKQG